MSDGKLRRVSGIWHHEIRRADESVVAADRARGAFLDLDGRFLPAPQEFLDDLLCGEPPAWVVGTGTRGAAGRVSGKSGPAGQRDRTTGKLTTAA